MLFKRRKRSDRKKKTTPIFLLIILPTSLLGLVLLGLYIYFSSGVARVATPLYEEIYSTTNKLHKGITKIDYTLYEFLYNSGILERDIVFSKIQPRHKARHFWDFTELSIRSPDEKSARDVQRRITRRLRALGPEIGLRHQKKSNGWMVCDVFVEKFYTHRIIFRFDRHRPPVEVPMPKIAIIIDDLGYSPNIAFSFIRSGLTLSFSVLPCAPFCGPIVEEAEKMGCEVLLHLPMEPKNYPSVDPGPGALFSSMSDQEIKRILNQDLLDVPGLRGVNNHMGSCFTENTDKMKAVLEELKKRNLFYIDSRTTKGTVGYKLAREIGVPTAKRNVFLDNDLDPKAIKIQMERLLSMARHSGFAIGIGHPHRETLKVIEEYYPEIKSNFQIVHVSDLVN